MLCDGDARLPPTEDCFKGSLLFPWCNRIAGVSYLTEDEKGELSVPVPVKQEKNGHLHGGEVADASWTLVSVKPASEVVYKLTIDPSKSEYYPHGLQCTVRYQVVGLGPSREEDSGEVQQDAEEASVLATINSEAKIPSFFTVDECLQAKDPEEEALVEGLRVEIEVESVEQKKDAWLGLGAHLYFRNPFGGPINELSMALRVKGEVVVDEALIPLHPVQIVDPPLDHDFDSLLPRPLGAIELDNCFQLDLEVAEEEEGAALAVLQKDHFLLEVIPERTESRARGHEGKPAVQFLQVYTIPDRSCIALEPQTSLANHFSYPYDPSYANNILKPSQSLLFSTLYLVTWS